MSLLKSLVSYPLAEMAYVNKAKVFKGYISFKNKLGEVSEWFMVPLSKSVSSYTIQSF